MKNQQYPELGPLAPLVGIWEGDKGHDTAPDSSRGTEINLFRERTTFEYIGRVDNHEQVLHGLRYATKAWRLGEADGFHEEVGYWLWDAAHKQVMRCFLVPRGVSLIAGGTAEADARVLHMEAKAGSETYGICSNLFLTQEFKTVRYSLKLTIHDQASYTYEEDTELKIKGQAAIFHHKDRNTMHRIG